MSKTTEETEPKKDYEVVIEDLIVELKYKDTAYIDKMSRLGIDKELIVKVDTATKLARDEIYNETVAEYKKELEKNKKIKGASASANFNIGGHLGVEITRNDDGGKTTIYSQLDPYGASEKLHELSKELDNF